MARDVSEQKLVKAGHDESLDANLAFYNIVGCKCEYAWKGLGMLEGINMGKGWVRITTHPHCPVHGDKAQAHFKKHGRWPR